MSEDWEPESKREKRNCKKEEGKKRNKRKCRKKAEERKGKDVN